MNKLDFAAINHALDPETVVPQWVPNGYKRGKEWVAANPTRNDRNPGSFTINLIEGHWKDFATGEGGGDLVSLYAYLFHANDQGAAAHELARNHGVRIGDPVVREQAAKVHKIEDAKPVPMLPVPASATEPKFWHPNYGTATTRWEYLDREGRLLLYVVRFDPEGERKQVLPYSWCVMPDNSQGWRWRGITRPRKVPLYGLDRLAANPEADAIVVEGEKATDAAARLFAASGAVPCSWLGGIENADRANITALAGRRVILWPDFDSQREKLTKEEEEQGVDPASKPFLPLHLQPGMRAMMAIAQNLKGVAREILLVGYAVGGEFAHGWDLADAEQDGWSTEQVAAYMAKNAGDPWHIASDKPAPEPVAQPEQPANDNTPRLPMDASVNPFGWPHLTDKGQPLNTAENLEYMLGEYGITCRYNQISKDVEIGIPGTSFSQDNRAAGSLATINSLCARNRMPKSDVSEYITLIADANQYNPAAEWIESKPWDGKDRIVDLVATLDPADAELAHTLLRRWMIGAVGCVYEPAGQSMQGVLVLQGPQNSGKTTWFWSLANRDKRLAREGVSLNPSDRDSVKGAISYWLVELGELDATFRKADVAALKQFLTKDQDELFLRYSRASSTFPRRTAFVGTVNPKHFLHDDTGNRRYWTIQHGEKLRGMHDVDMQQAWAQAKALWVAGEQHRLAREEMDRLNAVNEEHQEPNTLEELVLARYDWQDIGGRTNKMAASEVLIAIGYDRPNNKQAKDMGTVLRKLTGGEPVKSNGRQVFKMPPAMPSLQRYQPQEVPFSGGDQGRPF